MAFGVKRAELEQWKRKVKNGEIAFLTHYWLHPRLPEIRTVTKVGCANLDWLIQWGMTYDLKKEYIHFHTVYPHFDLFGQRQQEILYKEKIWEQIERFMIHPPRP